MAEGAAGIHNDLEALRGRKGVSVLSSDRAGDTANSEYAIKYEFARIDK